MNLTNGNLVHSQRQTDIHIGLVIELTFITIATATKAPVTVTVATMTKTTSTTTTKTVTDMVRVIFFIQIFILLEASVAMNKIPINETTFLKQVNHWLKFGPGRQMITRGPLDGELNCPHWCSGGKFNYSTISLAKSYIWANIEHFESSIHSQYIDGLFIVESKLLLDIPVVAANGSLSFAVEKSSKVNTCLFKTYSLTSSKILLTIQFEPESGVISDSYAKVILFKESEGGNKIPPSPWWFEVNNCTSATHTELVNDLVNLVHRQETPRFICKMANSIARAAFSMGRMQMPLPLQTPAGDAGDAVEEEEKNSRTFFRAK